MTSWQDVAMGALSALVPLGWGFLELRKRRLALEEAKAARSALDAEKKEHRKTKLAFKAQTQRFEKGALEEDPGE